MGQRGREGGLGASVAPKGFQVLPRRWVVERTFSWIAQNRRMSKDYERLCASGETLCICCHDSPHDEAARSCLRTVHTISLSTRVNKAKKKGWSLRLPGSGPS